MVFAVLRHAHDRGSSVLRHELSRPTVGLHDGVRLGKVGISIESRTSSMTDLQIVPPLCLFYGRVLPAPIPYANIGQTTDPHLMI